MQRYRSARCLLVLAAWSATWGWAMAGVAPTVRPVVGPVPAGSAGPPAPDPVGPTVRIGLSGNGRVIALESEGGLIIEDRDTGEDVWKHTLRGPVHVVLADHGREREKEHSVFRVQVASMKGKAAAEALATRLAQETSEVVDVAPYPERHAWRVRVGKRSSREEIREVEEKLRDMGFAETWIVQEDVDSGPLPRMRLVDEDYNDLVVSAKALLVRPGSRREAVRVEGVKYRGVVEIVITRAHRLQAVNVVDREEYLRGVVPKELGPLVYPEIEALKAQAVAARTYVEANRGQFAEDGYDICDTAQCQVYGGIPAEQELSDLAVKQTEGIIATYDGEPINALYTSTCGGHTEDIENVFKEMNGPYLKGVRCYPEEGTLKGLRRTLHGLWEGPPVVLPDGERIDEALSLLETLGVLLPGEVNGGHMRERPTAADETEWIRRTLKVIGKKMPEGFTVTRPAEGLPEFSAHLAQALGWQDRIQQLIHPDDLPVLLDEAWLASTPPEQRPALAYMVMEGIVPRVRGGSGPETPQRLTRGVLARAMYRLIVRYDAAGLKAAKYRGSEGEALVLQSGDDVSLHPLSVQLHLSVKEAGEPYPVSEYLLQAGDNLEYHLSGDGEIDYLLVKANRRGASDDRYSGVYDWETRVSRSDLQDRILQRLSIGRLIDLEPGRRGASGRILELTVVGSAGKFKAHGFSIERLLGLRETMFLVDRQYGADGGVETFIFSGKGWGHGVGLCQVGAYGMALRGKTFEQILRHYYTGITLERR